ncbi:MAG: hypothetical protein K6V97_06695 [Actinomycetia bacterium]|nr:hypothetical protein [Actinomycetes bacterium]
MDGYQTLRSDIKRLQATSEAAESAVLKARLSIPEKPPDDVLASWRDIVQAKNLSELPAHVLGDYLQHFQAAVAYALWAESVADVQFQTARAVREHIESRLLLLQESNRKDLQLAAVQSEPEYVTALEAELRAQHIVKLTRAVRQSYEGFRDVISREITRRDSEHRRLL